jgi:hypothetical protein
MASYGVFVAAEGFDYDGPRGIMSFAPRLTPDDFRAAFTAAQGWGSFAQHYVGAQFRAQIDLGYGKLRLKAVGLAPPVGVRVEHVVAAVDGKAIAAAAAVSHGKLVVHFHQWLVLHAGEKLTITCR